MHGSRQRGVTLVELVISITVIAIAVSSVLGVLTITTKGSADAMIRHQAVAIGNAYLEEVLLKPFADPEGGGGESVRATFDDVKDYDGLDDDGVRDQSGAPIEGLNAYRVRVTVHNASLGGLSSSSSVQLVDVRVTHPAGVDMMFSGYRTSY